jgi:riboflavin kinase / FMN adenylyltransferase
MKRFRSLAELPEGPGRAVAIGAFDGVHLGHQAIIGRAVELARENGLVSTVLTFDPIPAIVLRPNLVLDVLTGPGCKADLIERLGVDELVTLSFTRALSLVRADRFARMLVEPPARARAVAVGGSFRFGHRGRGNAATLAAIGRPLGMAVEVPETVTTDDGVPISSSRVRGLVKQGRVGEAASLLGRPHCVEGQVVAGDGRGRGLGIPTANFALPPRAALPARGVYAGRATIAGRGAFPAALNVGYAPTFAAADGPRPLRLEAFLLDYEDGDLYGERARVEFIERLRDERRFESVEALLAQVDEDVRRTREAALETGPAVG